MRVRGEVERNGFLGDLWRPRERARMSRRMDLLWSFKGWSGLEVGYVVSSLLPEVYILSEFYVTV